MQNNARKSRTSLRPILSLRKATVSEKNAAVDPTPHDTGHTTPRIHGDLSPRLPHERDESSDSQTSEPRPIMLQAHKDLESGLVDTDRGPVLDALYEEQIRAPGNATRDRGAPEDLDGKKKRPARVANRQ